MTNAGTTSPVSPNDPRLNQPEYSLYYYDADGALRLNERYYDRLSKDTREFVIGLIRLGMEKEAKRVATCGQHGVVDKECADGHSAHACCLLCHIPLDKHCGKSEAVLTRWAQTRDMCAIATSATHYGLELHLPVGALEKLGDREIHYRLKSLTTKLLNKLGVQHVVVMDQIRQSSIRISVTTKLNYSVVAAMWQKVCRTPGAWCQLGPSGTGVEGVGVLAWVASGYEAALKLSGVERAALRKALKGCHILRIKGRYYSPLAKTELAKLREERKARKHICGVCRKPMIDIPLEEQYQQPMTAIHDNYPYVDWSSTHDPFQIGKIRRVMPYVPLSSNLSWLGTPIDQVRPSPPS